jgi:hypothetical protein
MLCAVEWIACDDDDDGHRGDQNMFVKNNMWLNMFINVHLLVYRISMKYSSMHGHGTHKVKSSFTVWRCISILCYDIVQSKWHEDHKLQCTESSYRTSLWLSAVMKPTSKQYSIFPGSSMPVIPVAFTAVMLCCNCWR